MDIPDDFTPGRPVALHPGLRRVVAPNGGRMTGPGTNTYLLGDRAVWVIDPGPALPAHQAALERAIGTARVAGIVVTHTHRDHSPLAAALHAATGAPRIGALPRGRAHHDESFIADLTATDGQVLATDVGDLRLIATPGHASNHFCLWWEAAGFLFTGDHVLEGVTPVILPPDGDMGDYLAALRRLQELPLRAIAPGHGGVIRDPQANLAYLVAHRLKREGKVIAGLRAAAAAVTLDDLLPLAYDDVPVEMHGWARHSLLAHVLKLVHEGAARAEGAGEPDTQRYALVTPAAVS